MNLIELRKLAEAVPKRPHDSTYKTFGADVVSVVAFNDFVAYERALKEFWRGAYEFDIANRNGSGTRRQYQEARALIASVKAKESQS